MNSIDLHVHTTMSDGTMSPEDIVKHAKEIGLKAIAITDHDNVAGHGAALAAGIENDIEVITGVEISTKFGCSVHILGYFIDTDTTRLLPILQNIVKNRDLRNEKIAELMRQDGLDVNYNVMKTVYDGSIGRPHFAKELMRLGIVNSITEGIDNYISRGKKYYVPRTVYPIEDAVKDIRNAGGIPVLAHPYQYKMNDKELRILIEKCIENGLMGMECYYTGYSKEQINYLLDLSKEYNLLVTGGSDFHGKNKPNIQLGTGDGNLNVPYKLLEILKNN